MWIRPVLALLLIITGTSCSNKSLHVHSEYFNNEKLASYILGTPDPKKNSSTFEQRLVVSWNIPSSLYSKGQASLILKWKLKSGECFHQEIALSKKSGTLTKIFPIEELHRKAGLLSYLVQLKANGTLIATSRHKLWVEDISLEDEWTDFKPSPTETS